MTEHQPDVPAIPGVTRYRIREPVFINAIEWTGGNEEAVREFAGGYWDASVPPCYLARGITGHLFTVDADRFAATHEPAGEPLVRPPDEFEAVRVVARTLGMVATKPCGCGPDEPCAAHPGTSPPVAAALDPETAKLREGARMLGKVVVGQHRAMEAARIELAQGGAGKAMQWILNSLPDVWDDPETAWDGRESANEWWDRTDGFYRAAEADAKPPASDDTGRDVTTALVKLQARAEAAETKLAAIAEHCRLRMNAPGRSGMTMAAAGLILGLAEGNGEEAPDGR